MLQLRLTACGSADDVQGVPIYNAAGKAKGVQNTAFSATMYSLSIALCNQGSPSDNAEIHPILHLLGSNCAFSTHRTAGTEV